MADPLDLPGKAIFVGIDIGGTKCLAVAVDGEGAPVGSPVRVATPSTTEELFDVLADVVRRVSYPPGMVAGVGLGLPGRVDEDGILRFANNFPAGEDVNLSMELGRRLDVPVHAENDAACAALGEYRLGAGRATRNMVLVTLGTGIGGGIVIGGALYRGNGLAGEIGHMVIDMDGPPCTCGRNGCWEVLASGGGLARLAMGATDEGKAMRVLTLAGGDPGRIRGEHVSSAALEGDAEAMAVMEEFAARVGVGLVNLANVLDPEVFVIAGGVAAAGEALFGPLTRALERFGTTDGSEVVRAVPAALGEGAGAIGAASLARSV